MASVAVAAGEATAAEFTMNFLPNPDPDTSIIMGASLAETHFSCNRGSDLGCGVSMTTYLANENTPFHMEHVVIGGEMFTHVIVGDPSQGFAQDVYIRGTSSVDGFASGYSLAYNDPSAAAGTGPLTGPGNASANPEKVVMRQIVGGEWDAATSTWSCGAASFCNDFVKATLAGKPRITQTVIDGDVTSYFDMDMSGIGYKLAGGETLDDMLAAPVINTVTVEGVSPGDFAMTDAYTGDLFVTGGRFIYNDGIGAYNSEGTYDYADGDFDVDQVDWASYRDPDPAVNPVINP